MTTFTSEGDSFSWTSMSFFAILGKALSSLNDVFVARWICLCTGSGFSSVVIAFMIVNSAILLQIY